MASARPVIVPRLTGGLGNRIFQYAAAKGLAEKWGGQCMYRDDAVCSNDHGNRDDICRLFPEPLNTETDVQWEDCKDETYAECYTYKPFPPTPPTTDRRYMVHGFRQTEKYFPTTPLRPQWEAFLSETERADLLKRYNLMTNRSTAWSLHIRLGDYKILPHHQIDIFQYSQQCLSKLPRDARVFLFSDEFALCEPMIRRMCGLRNLSLTTCHEDVITSLWLMSQMEGGAIVCNSSFSWWGAYFAHITTPNPDLFVAFFPDKWGRGMPPAIDVVPSWGRRVKN